MITYIVPPSNFEFNVIIIEPIQIITKTSANSGPPSPLCEEFDDACNTLKVYIKNSNKWLKQCFVLFY